ncbi:MAG: NapC/NirT family cytochrome c [Bacillota bacterium]
MNKEKLFKSVIIAAALMIMFAISAVAGMKYTSRPDFCANCHLMKPAVEAWAVTSHKEITCLACHSNPGLTGYVKQKMKGLGELYIYLSGAYDSKFEVKINPNVCIGCHGKNSKLDKAKDVTAADGPRATAYPHNVYIENKISCVDCHKNFVHTKKTADNGKFQSCMTCHVNIKGVKTKDVTATKGPGALKYPHQELVKSGIPCTDCHKNFVHGKKEIAGSETEKCMACHSNSKTAKIKDITLTTGPGAPAFPHQGLLEAKTSCAGCHNSVHK